MYYCWKIIYKKTNIQENHDFMMVMVTPMVQDPRFRLQMMSHMTENPEAMAVMQQMTGYGMIGA